MKLKNKRLLSFVLSLVMILAMLPMTASAATAGDTLYLQPNSNWTSDGARFAAVLATEGWSKQVWVDCTDADSDGIYECTIPTDGNAYAIVIFCRMNPSTTENNWNNKWNQTADLDIPTDNKIKYVVDGWDKSGVWAELGGNVVIEKSYYVMGDMNGWSASDAWKLSESGDVYTLTTEMAAGTYGLKIADAGWSVEWPSGYGTNYELVLDVDSNVTFTFDPAKAEGTVVAEPVAVEEPEAVQYQTRVVNGQTDIRLVTYADSLEYKDVTFNITKADGQTAQLSCQTVYEAIVADGTEITDAGKVFGNDAKYFVTYVIKGVPADEVVTVSVTWTDLEGNTVTSEARTINLGSN